MKYKCVMVVSGGRKCRERKRCQDEFWKYLKECGRARKAKDRSECFVLVGDATGVDDFIWEVCKSKGIPHKRFKANWKKFGKGAGPIRNQEMLDYKIRPTNVFFYWDGESPGTLDMRTRVSKTFLPNCTVYYDK